MTPLAPPELFSRPFVYAAALNIMDPAAFVVDIGHYRLLPYPLVLALGLYLPWLELLCGTAVLIRRIERGALVILIGLCTLFCLALASAWFRDLDIDCGCFGRAVSATSLPLALVRSFALGLIGVHLLTHTTLGFSGRSTTEGRG